MAPKKKKESTKDNLRWTVEMDEAFINSLLEEMSKGNRPDGTFSTLAYSNVLDTLHNLFGSQITKQHLKNRKKTLSQRFGELYDMFNGLSGFSWNSDTKLFEAESQIWNDLIEKKPTATKWKNTPIMHYDKLYDLFSTDRVTGNHSETAKSKLKRWEHEIIDLNESCDGVEEDNDTSYSIANMDFSATMGTSTQSKGTTSSSGQKRKATVADIMDQNCEKMSEGMKEMVEVLREGNSLQDKSISVAQRGLTILEQSRPRHYSGEEVWAELDKIEIDEDHKLKFYLFLCKEENAKGIFFGAPQHMRLRALIKLMNDSGIY